MDGLRPVQQWGGKTASWWLAGDTGIYDDGHHHNLF
jgi:hypothetical protein